MGLRLPPGVGPAVLGVPAHELTDRRAPLDAIWPTALVRDLAERLAAAEGRPGDLLAADGGPGDLLDRAAAARLRDGRRPRPGGRADRPAARGRRDRGRRPRPRSGSARASCTGAATELFGYGPKTLARILRLRRALALARRRAAGAPGRRRRRLRRPAPPRPRGARAGRRAARHLRAA